jgi:hypothetical protein
MCSYEKNTCPIRKSETATMWLQNEALLPQEQVQDVMCRLSNVIETLNGLFFPVWLPFCCDEEPLTVALRWNPETKIEYLKHPRSTKKIKKNKSQVNVFLRKYKFPKI